MLIELKENPWNTYEVLIYDVKYTKIRCQSFVKSEDLGDGILCTRQGQEICIASYFWHRFTYADY